MTEFRATQPRDRSDLTELWQEAFGDEPGYIDSFFETAYAPRRSRAAIADGVLAGMLFWFDCALGERRIAYLYAVATAKTHQGRGIASALMEDTHLLLAEQGYDAAVLSPGSERLFRFYERLGYVTAGAREELRVQAGKAIPVRELEPAEYALLRASLLPENGIRQEGANLAFLARWSRLVGGEGFCAAVSRDGAFVPEFLGDRRLLPGLLGAMGISEAAVRGPGDRIPCAMVRWFRDAGGERVYLGFPFD